jgi:cysteine desulfurase family protein (TIGR01976 family)
MDARLGVRSCRMSSNEHIRSLFPALASTQTVFLDNAGGSQLPGCVIDAMTSYLTRSYANTGGEYPESLAAAKTINGAHDLVRVFVNGDGVGEVVLGASTTALVHTVANAHGDAMDAARAGTGRRELLERDEIIVSSAGHEANIGPWMRLASRGFKLTIWPTELDVDGVYRPKLSTLRALVSKRTLLVAFPQVSNILGEVWDAKAVCEIAHSVGARACIDGVAYAPHHAPDVQDLNADWYVYSPYKVFGPHSGALFGKHEAFAELNGPNHFFIAENELPRKWEPGGVSHEACAGLVALWDFACQVTRENSREKPNRKTLARALGVMAEHEAALQSALLDAISKLPSFRLLGPMRGSANRVATISFVHDSVPSEAIARRANQAGLGIRWGHFYSKRLVEEMGIESSRGVVRASLVGYNTHEDVRRLATFLSEGNFVL